MKFSDVIVCFLQVFLFAIVDHGLKMYLLTLVCALVFQSEVLKCCLESLLKSYSNVTVLDHSISSN